MTLNDVVKRVKDRSHRGAVGTTTDEITAQIIRAINDARRDIIVLLPKSWLRKTSSFPTVSGTTTYSLASDVQEPALFRYTTGGSDYLLIKVDSEREFYQKYYSSTAGNSKPQYYFDAGIDSSGYRQILLSPTPDAAYTVNYVYQKDGSATDLSTSDLATAIPDIPNHLQGALWKGALYYFLKGFDDPAQLVAKKDFQEALMDTEIAEERDLDTNLAFRWGVGGPGRQPGFSRD